MLQRLLRATSVILVMFITERLLSPMGLGWVAYVIGAIAFLFLGYLSWRRKDPLDRHIARWLGQGLEASTRVAAIDEARQALAQAHKRRGSTWKSRELRVRLALSELLCAEGKLDEARHALEMEPPPSNLSERLALQLAEATVALRRGQQGEAENLLKTFPQTAAPSLNAQKMLLEIATMLGANEAERALEHVNLARRHCVDFPSLRLQLRLYHAAALAQLGQSNEAKAIVADLDQPARMSAAVYGLPPVRAVLREQPRNASS